MAKIPHISGVLRTTLIASALLVGSTAFAAITVGLSTVSQSVDITYSKLTLNTPASVASGDLLLATVAVKNGTTGIITAPSGWTLIRRTDKTTDVGLATYYHVANSSEPSSYGWDISPNTHVSGGITRYSGVDQTIPIDVSADNFGHSTTASAPSVTTLHDGDRLIAVFAARGGSNAGNFSTVAGMTEEYDTGYSPNGPSISLQDTTQVSSSATGAKNSTLSNAGQDWVAQTITLRAMSTTTHRYTCAEMSNPDGAPCNNNLWSSLSPFSVFDGGVNFQLIAMSTWYVSWTATGSGDLFKLTCTGGAVCSGTDYPAGTYTDEVLSISGGGPDAVLYVKGLPTASDATLSNLCITAFPGGCQ